MSAKTEKNCLILRVDSQYCSTLPQKLVPVPKLSPKVSNGLSPSPPYPQNMGRGWGKSGIGAPFNHTNAQIASYKGKRSVYYGHSFMLKIVINQNMETFDIEKQD